MSKIRLSGQDRKSLAAAIKADIDNACMTMYDEGVERNHLGASIIGEKCNRRLWYSFRWMHREQFSGRVHRLFNRGHLEENRLIEWLKAIKAQVFAHTDDGKQFRITGVDEHYGGSLDSIIKLPKKYKLDIPFLGEYKTHNDKSFNALVKNGVAISKPKHYIQMCCYGSHLIYNFDYAIYFAINKNDDKIYIEVVQLDHEVGVKHLHKAEQIIHSQTAPNRISGSAAYSECVYCPMRGVCHKGEAVDVNCRSCRNAIPAANAEWYCSLHNAIIPKKVILTGCPQWKVLEQ